MFSGSTYPREAIGEDRTRIRVVVEEISLCKGSVSRTAGSAVPTQAFNHALGSLVQSGILGAPNGKECCLNVPEGRTLAEEAVVGVMLRGASSSVVERSIAARRVTGSNPVSRLFFFRDVDIDCWYSCSVQQGDGNLCI